MFVFELITFSQSPPADPVTVKPELSKKKPPKPDLLEDLKIDDKNPPKNRTNSDKAPEDFDDPPAEGENPEGDDIKKGKKKCVVM